MEKNKKPVAILDTESGDEVIIYAKFRIAGGPLQHVKHVISVREYGNIHVEKETRNYG